MGTFYKVTILALLIGMAIASFFAPWTTTPAGSSAPHDSLGYAALWSQQFASVPGARVDTGAFATISGVVVFFATTIGAIAYFFRNKRGSERED
jgi:hypothetical protein